MFVTSECIGGKVIVTNIAVLEFIALNSNVKKFISTSKTSNLQWSISLYKLQAIGLFPLKQMEFILDTKPVLRFKILAYKKLKYWFDKELAILLATKLQEVEPKFGRKEFVATIDRKVTALELKDRVEVIADELYDKLGRDYKKALPTLLKILGPKNEQETGMFTNFYWVMPIAKFIEKYGLQDFEESMYAIKEITKRNTGEYTIRPFLERHTKKTISQMKKWSKHKNLHVRRLSCEGLRPRLPWAKKLELFIENPDPILAILNSLKDDPSKYVQKSVANCINDILKDNPATVRTLIEKWNGKSIGKERKWIIKHALRNLLKADDDWAKKIVG